MSVNIICLNQAQSLHLQHEGNNTVIIIIQQYLVFWKIMHWTQILTAAYKVQNVQLFK